MKKYKIAVCSNSIRKTKIASIRASFRTLLTNHETVMKSKAQVRNNRISTFLLDDGKKLKAHNISILMWACNAEYMFCIPLREKIRSLYENIKCFTENCPRLKLSTDISKLDTDINLDTKKYLIISYSENKNIDWTTEQPIYKKGSKKGSVVEFPENGGTAFLFYKYISQLGKDITVDLIFRSEGILSIKEKIKEFYQMDGKKKIIIIGHNDNTSQLSGQYVNNSDLQQSTNLLDNLEDVADYLDYTL